MTKNWEDKSNEYKAKQRDYMKEYRLRNKEKINAYQRKHRAAHPDKVRTRHTNWLNENKEHMREWRRQYRLQGYGLTDEQLAQWFLIQDNACAICRTSFDDVAPHIDHCHTTGVVRGLLCPNCNKALGLFKDNSMHLLAAAAYLQ